jgi:biopolymer transport protein ExbD
MGFDVGGSGGKHKVRPSMNVTPLVDVVLVLLIIFMVITPMMVKQFRLHVPKKDDKAAKEPETEPDPSDVSIVLSVRRDGSVWVNRDPVRRDELADKLARIFAARADKVVFFDADDSVPYGQAMAVLLRPGDGRARPGAWRRRPRHRRPDRAGREVARRLRTASSTSPSRRIATNLAPPALQRMPVKQVKPAFRSSFVRWCLTAGAVLTLTHVPDAGADEWVEHDPPPSPRTAPTDAEPAAPAQVVVEAPAPAPRRTGGVKGRITDSVRMSALP